VTWRGTAEVVRGAPSVAVAAGGLLACALGALAACPFEAAKLRVHAAIRPLPAGATGVRAWLGRALRTPAPGQVQPLSWRPPEQPPGQLRRSQTDVALRRVQRYWVERAAGAAAAAAEQPAASRQGVAGRLGKGMDADSAALEALLRPGGVGRLLGGWPGLFHGGALTFGRAVVYHVILGLSFEAAASALRTT
jgi:hypothetical protein